MPVEEQQLHQILELEAKHFRLAGSKDRQIRECLKLTPTRYYQLLSQVLDDPRALRVAPGLVIRLRARRDRQRWLRPA